MKGYIVGYFEEWGSDRNAIIVGYYDEWEKALDTAKIQEKYNLDYRKGRCDVYIVELKTNETYKPTKWREWIYNYPHFKLKTIKGETFLLGDTNIKLDLSSLDWSTVKSKKKKAR